MANAQTTIDRMTAEHGRVSVRDGFADGIIRVTTPDGSEYKVDENGFSRFVGHNHSVRWDD